MAPSDKQIFQRELAFMGLSFSLVLILSFFVPIETSVFGILPAALFNLYFKYFPKKTLNKNAQ